MRSNSLFEPDILIAEVWGAAQRRGAQLSSEKRLMLAVLEDAFDCYQKYIFASDRIGRQLFEEAATWIDCRSPDGLFSFESITEALDIESEYFRRGVAEWRRRHNSHVQSNAPQAPLASAAPPSGSQNVPSSP